MRTIIISDTQGNQVGTITQSDDGKLKGDGKGESLVEQAPGKTIDEWLETGHHSKYLRYEEAA